MQKQTRWAEGQLNLGTCSVTHYLPTTLYDRFIWPTAGDPACNLVKVCALADCTDSRCSWWENVQPVSLAYIQMPYMEKRTVNCIMGRRRKSLELWPESPQINGCSIPKLIYQRLYCCSDISLQTIGNLTYMHYNKTHSRHTLEWSNQLDGNSSRHLSKIPVFSRGE